MAGSRATVQSPAAWGTRATLGRRLHPATAAETAAAVTPVDYSFSERPQLDVRRYGWVVNDDDSSNAAANDVAIASAIAVAVQMGGADIVFPPGIGRTLSTITLYDGVRLIGATGAGSGTSQPGSQIRYMGGEFVDVVASDDTATQCYGVINLRLLGGLFQAGTARYGFYAGNFHRECIVTGCVMRDCVGAIKIVSGYYGHVHHNQFGPVTPSQVAADASDEEWAEVHGPTSAAVYFGDVNGSDLSHNRFLLLTGEESTGVTPTTAIRVIGGEGTNCRGWVVESVGIDNGTFSPRVAYCIRTSGIVDFSGLYVEKVDVISYFLYSQGESVAKLDGFILYDMSGATCFYNDAFGDLVVANGKAYRMDFARAWFNLTSGLGAGGSVLFSNVSWMCGERRTDAAVNADPDNVHDTAGTANLLGAVDGTLIQSQHRRHFPRRTTGLVVTSSSDDDGDFVQITCGTLLSELGDYVHVKFRTGPQPATGNFPVQRLRPTTASKWYRVWVGRHGGLYLVQHDAEPTAPVGDWLAEFQTDESAHVTGLTANPRLSLRGLYIPGSSIAQISATSSSAPSSSDKRWSTGDIVWNHDPALSEPIGWMFNGGSWFPMGIFSSPA